MRPVRFTLVALVVVCAVNFLTAAPASAALDKVLVFSKTAGFRHDSIPAGITAIQQLGADNGFAVDATEDGAQFTDANLAQYDAVIWLSTTGDVLTDEQQAAFERYIRAGNGYVGIHAAADTEYDWGWYGDLVGGYFASHPAGTPTASVDIEDAAHPSTATVPTRWTRTDEWYNYKPPAAGAASGADYSPRYDVHVLATVDESTYGEADGSDGVNDDHPIAWCSDFDGGHSWYTGMGHTIESFGEADFQEHLLGGIKAVTGAAASDCGPERVPSPSAADFEKVTLDDDTAESLRARHRPRRARLLHRARRPRDALAAEHRDHDPDRQRAGHLSQENGLLGIQLAPDFATTGHLYLAYSALPDSSNQNRISRFTVVGNQIDPASEQIIYTWQHQRQECCHTAGSLAFGLDGSLYLSTGDNSNPFASDGYAPIDERARPRGLGRPAHRGELEQPERQDPARSSRCRTRAACRESGRRTRSRPATCSTRPRTRRTRRCRRSTRWASATRSGSRVDPKTGWVLLGDYGPDAGTTNPNRGPQGSVEFNVIDEPGFYGWPYCVRDNVPYNDYNFATATSGAEVRLREPGQQLAQQHGPDEPAGRAAARRRGTATPSVTARFPYLGTRRRPDGRPALRLRPRQHGHDEVPRVLRRQVVHRRMEQRLDQDGDAERRRQRRRGVGARSTSSPATSARWTWSSVPTARCT